MKNMHISFQLSDERKKAISDKLLRNREIFFFAFWGALLIYSFNIVYNKVYIDVNYINHEGSSDFASAYCRENAVLEKIIQNIETRKTNLENNKGKLYDNPFISAYEGEVAARDDGRK